MTDKPPSAATPDGADPSMEDILASIRRILNEEETPASAEAAAETSGDEDVLVLDQSMLVSAGETGPEMPEPPPEPDPEPEPPAQQAEPIRQEVAAIPPFPEPDVLEPPAPTSGLLGPAAAAAAASSVGSLVRTLAADRRTQVYSGGPTLEDMVRAELRPLLKDWLDAHLPPLVERLVRTEIERVVGRAVP
jgi:uncharacterized protein